MTTPTYPILDHFHPHISNTRIHTLNTTRNNVLNLRDFSVSFAHTEQEDSYACLTTNVDGRIAVAEFNSLIPDGKEVGYKSPEQCAKHEAFHLFLSKMLVEAVPNYSRNVDTDLDATEGAVRVLEKLL
jgi:hypothetical protein